MASIVMATQAVIRDRYAAKARARIMAYVSLCRSHRRRPITAFITPVLWQHYNSNMAVLQQY